MRKEYISKSEEDTINFASQFASKLQLGNEISSPTFTIVNEYTDSTIPIYHFDVYRLADIEEFYAIGGEEYFSKGICIIEWGELLENILPADYIKITINKYLENENYRKIIVETFGNIKL